MTSISPRYIGYAVAAVLCGWTAASIASSSQSIEIPIANFAFKPASLTVPVGTRVVWINKDEEPHLVFSINKLLPFKSPALDTDDKFSFVFDKPGTYKYFCQIHPQMVGTIVVK